MASKKRYGLNEEEDEEQKIPVFTVLKNGAILKNIFIVNKSPPHLSQLNLTPTAQTSENPSQGNEEILIVGRHPDCNIMLTHPSISRFHLEILSDPSSQNLSVIDLKSIHGTWVSDKKLKPWDRVKLKEGDTLRIGGSSRVYRLHWIPLSQAYDLENPYVSASDVPMAEKNEHESAGTEDENSMEEYMDEKSLPIENKPIEEKDTVSRMQMRGEEEVCESENSLGDEIQEIQSLDSVAEQTGVFDEIQCPDSVAEQNGVFEYVNAMEAYMDEKYFPIEEKVTLEVERKEVCESDNSLGAENQEFQSLDSIVEGINSLFFYENLGSIDKGIPSAPLMPENMIYSLYVENEEFCESSFKDVCGLNEISRQSVYFPLYVEGAILENENPENDVENHGLQPLSYEREQQEFPSTEREKEEEEEEADLAAELTEEIENPRPSSEDHALPVAEIHWESVGEVLAEIEHQRVDMENLIPEPVSILQSVSDKSRQETVSLFNLNSSCPNGAVHSASKGLGNGDQDITVKDHLQRDVSVEFSAALMTESENSSLPTEEALLEIADDKCNQAPQTHSAATGLPQVETGSPMRSDKISSFGILMTESVNSSLPVEEAVLEIADDKENQTPKTHIAATELPQVETSSLMRSDMISSFGILMTESVNSSLPHEDAVLEIADHNESQTPQSHIAATLLPQVEISSPMRSDKISSFGKLMTESTNSSFPAEEALFEIVDDKENQTPQSHITATGPPQVQISSPKSDKITSFGSIWLRRGKPASVLQIQIDRSRSETTGDGVHAEDERHKDEDMKGISISEEILSCGEEEEIFTPDKENFTPNTLLLKSLKKMGKLEEVKHSKSYRSSISNVTKSSNIHLEENLSLHKDNQMSRVLSERKSVNPTTFDNKVLLEQELMIKKRRTERFPFQSLAVGCKTEALGLKTASRNNASVNYTQTMAKKVNSPLSNTSVQEDKRGWNMVVDTATLLNKKSRKSLELLQGLKGTHLVIPRMVLRELDCSKRHGSLFRRKAEASLVLEWIEECMVKTNWWISIQSSEEDRRLTAPTPLASPQSPFSEGSGGFPFGTRSSLSFLSHGGLMEIASPRAEDHILDCARLCRKTKNDKQLVVLSDDVMLKIKAMAEGLICETVQEFRGSLVNPFSDRFLWTDSSPRGQTWSYLDDIILREKYNCCPMKKSSKGDAKGLKLILLHNSHYGQITPTS
ncbi:hypothetical protein FNV43_RR10640 [Rhamnella rubrinervis]|uniref:FHA domain-containing protein n=1 Tax=Rhamnella rubrinervis TaxID=2594499 RepID=A0A8K0H4G0_9ROSA|nr:hypothetical protein FNV43_RR10640 [Rhamnella rubrinervis]